MVKFVRDYARIAKIKENKDRLANVLFNLFKLSKIPIKVFDITSKKTIIFSEILDKEKVRKLLVRLGYKERRDFYKGTIFNYFKDDGSRITMWVSKDEELCLEVFSGVKIEK